MYFVSILDIILFISLVVFICKNIFMNYRLSNSWMRNSIIIILICIIGISCFYGVSFSMYTAQANKDLEATLTQKELRESEKEELSIIKEGIKEQESIAIYASVIGWTLFALIEMIQRKYLKAKQSEPAKGTWKLDKYK